MTWTESVFIAAVFAVAVPVIFYLYQFFTGFEDVIDNIKLHQNKKRKEKERITVPTHLCINVVWKRICGRHWKRF